MHWGTTSKLDLGTLDRFRSAKNCKSRALKSFQQGRQTRPVDQVSQVFTGGEPAGSECTMVNQEQVLEIQALGAH